jgi:hypothetical protein
MAICGKDTEFFAEILVSFLIDDRISILSGEKDCCGG